MACTPGTEGASDVCLGRQPIYDGRREIRAYELLYRRSAFDISATITDGDQASAQVVLKAFLDIGLRHISPERPVFINHTRTLLDMQPIIPPDRCVIEVLEDTAPDKGTVQALARLRSMGYRIALDDFISPDPRVVLLKYADYVKVDARLITGSRLHDLVRELQQHPVTIVAEKVESEREFDQFREWGCHLFQGYYLRKPENVSGRHIPSNRLSVLALLAECMDQDKSVKAIAAIIDRDAALAYGLLRLSNSALYARPAEIHSITQAVAMLGLDAVLRWSMLLALARFEDCPMGYLDFALQRARASELLAVTRGYSPYPAYMVGMMSTLDSILNAPLEDVVEPLPLETPVKNALLQREGVLGAVLNAVTAQESGRFDIAVQQGFTAETLRQAFWEAADYAGSMMASLALESRPGA
jgi:EAL and modified HD-GYP domain-containing signal transduction protein